MEKSIAFRVDFFQWALKDSAFKSSCPSLGKGDKYVSTRYLSLTDLENESEKLLTTQRVEGDWFLISATTLKAWSEPRNKHFAPLFPSVGPFLSEDSIIYVFSLLFVPLFHYLLELREQSMSDVYADAIVILEHFKLVHVFFVYCNIWWKEEKKHYQGIYKQ